MSMRRTIVLSIAVIGGGLLVWRLASSLYLAPRRELLAEIANVQKEINARREVISGEVALRRQLRDVSQRTLGGTAEEAISAFRARLNTIGHGVGLSDLRVSTSPVRALDSPASAAHSRESGWKAMARQPDFLEISAEFSGQGTLEQVVRAIEILEAEPYVKRLNRVTLRPRREGEVVDLSTSLTTIILPDTAAQALPDPSVAQPTLFAALAQKNIFRAPPPPAPPPAVRLEPTPAVAEHRPPPIPWGDWVVTGIAWIDGQGELWVRNTKTSESKQLRSGDRLLDAQIEAINHTEAIVSIDGARFLIEIGQTLGDRRAVDQ